MKFTSPIISAASGSVAGLTFSRNQGGQYIRKRAVPTNPNSTEQQAARAALSSCGDTWTQFGQEDRDAWAAYADATSWTDALGESIKLSGWQAFCRWATLRNRIGQTADIAPPMGTSGFGSPPIGIILEATGPEATVDIDPVTPVDGDVLVQISDALPPGVNSEKRPLTLDGFATALFGSSSITVPLATGIEENERRVARAVIVYDDGRVSAAFSDIETVIDAPPAKEAKTATS